MTPSRDPGTAAGGVAYRRGRSQRLLVAFSVADRARLPGIDAWMEGVLGMPACQPVPDEGLPWAWMRRVLAFTLEMLRVARFPLFDEARVVAVRPQPGGVPDAWEAWEAWVDVPCPDGLPAEPLGVALRAAARLCEWAAQQPPDEPRRREFFAALEKDLLGKVSRMLVVGKSTPPLLGAAHAAGIPFVSLGSGVFQLGWGSRSRRFDRSAIDLDSAIGSRLSHSKSVSAALLRRAGLPAPVHEQVRSLEAALGAAAQLGWPVVVKPADRDRGEGVTVDVADAQSMADAFAGAAKLSRSGKVLVERQVPGVCHRLFIADGELLYAVKRLPMSIAGDGRRSVAALVDAEVRRQAMLPPWRRSELRPLDDAARAAMALAGWSESDVPPEGVLVPLRRIESTAWGGVDEEVTGQVHPVNLAVAVTAAALFGLRVAGIDIITTAIDRPWTETGGIVNEVNFAPLLGGGEVSRREIPRFLARLLDGDGRIPVEVFVGGGPAWEAALIRWRRMVADGLRAWLTCADRTLGPDGADWPMTVTGAADRARALLLLQSVDALVLVIDEDSLRREGLPFDRVSRLHRL